MRVPLSWLREYVDLPETETGRDVQAKLVSVGLEVETVEQIGAGLKGPLVVGQVLTIEELEGFKKPIRFCTVDVGAANGTGEPQEIVCGARNFSVGDKVVVVLPGAVLPGDFAIAARKTYGKTSHGMICSTDELGMGDDGTHGIIVLPPEHEVGTDAVELLQLVDEVLDIAVTPDRGYCLSMRGVARETATAYGLPLRDPALLDVPAPNAYGYPVKISDPIGCDRFTARTVTGLQPEARSPIWMQRRLQKAGMRPISLAVDITNYVMLELGQPLHAYDRNRVQGAIGVRRATQGEKLTTLDGTVRVLDAEDLVITDDRGPIGLAGVMGGANTEIADADGEHALTTEVVIEAAHFDAISIARTARRHRLSSEASKRFERGVDPQAAAAAAQRTVDLLVLLAGGTAEAGVTEISSPSAPRTIAMPRPTTRTGWLGRRVRPGDRRPPPPAGRLRRLRAGRAHRHRPVLAARPERAERPGRRGHPAGGLREPALHPADAPLRARPHRAPAAAPPHRPGARRVSLRRGAELPVHRRRGPGPARPGGGRRPPPHGHAGQPALRRGGAAHHAAAGPPRRPAAQRRARRPRPGALRDRPRVPAHGRGDGRRPPPGRPATTDEEIAGLNAALPRQPRRAAVVLAGAREQALVGQGHPGHLGGRRRGGPVHRRRGRGGGHRPRRPARSVAPGPLRRAVRHRERRGDPLRTRGRTAPARDQGAPPA